MNLMGKILVVLILVFSMVFMGITLAVYATHTNWRLVVDNENASAGQPLGLRQQRAAPKELFRAKLELHPRLHLRGDEEREHVVLGLPPLRRAVQNNLG